MEKQKYRLEFWKNGKKINSKIVHELPRINDKLTKDFYITKRSDMFYTVKEVKAVPNSLQTTYVTNKGRDNFERKSDESYLILLE